MTDTSLVIQRISEEIETKIGGECYRVAKTLWELIVEKAKFDPFYKMEFSLWLNGDEGTTHLRDVVAAPFKNHDFNTEMWNPFGNAWASIDSWGSKVIRQDTLLCSEITLGDGTKLLFSYYENFANPVFVSETGDRYTIEDDTVYTVTDYDEACSALPKHLQPEIFKTHTYDFFKGDLTERAGV